jgi:hypothetical protein
MVVNEETSQRFVWLIRTSIKARAALLTLGGVAFIAGLLATDIAAQAQAPFPPDVVKIPSGINLGSSSFYDGFGSTDPGWTSLNYLRWIDFTSIKDGGGNNSPLFADPHINAISTLVHAVYVPPIAISGGAISFEALLPIVDFQSHFNAPGAVLQDNGLNFGDMTFGAAYQSKPISLGSQSVLSWRVDLDITAPTGGFDSNKNINQSSGFWSLSPYLALSLLPIPKWEVSARFNYIYNFSTSRGSDPPQIPGFVFSSGQAGQAGWINFASSYEVIEGVRPGLNGFWLQQLTNDSTNGISLPGTRVEELYLGPGLDWQLDNTSESAMASPDEIPALRQKAIELMETALKITEETGDETSGFLIERALDQMRADAWPDAIDDAPSAH